jgi:transposase-like protein
MEDIARAFGVIAAVAKALWRQRWADCHIAADRRRKEPPKCGTRLGRWSVPVRGSR